MKDSLWLKGRFCFNQLHGSEIFLKLIVSYLFWKLFCIYGDWRFLHMFNIAHRLSLPRERLALSILLITYCNNILYASVFQFVPSVEVLRQIFCKYLWSLPCVLQTARILSSLAYWLLNVFMFGGCFVPFGCMTSF